MGDLLWALRRTLQHRRGCRCGLSERAAEGQARCSKQKSGAGERAGVRILQPRSVRPEVIESVVGQDEVEAGATVAEAPDSLVGSGSASWYMRSGLVPWGPRMDAAACASRMLLSCGCPDVESSAQEVT